MTVTVTWSKPTAMLEIDVSTHNGVGLLLLLGFEGDLFILSMRPCGNEDLEGVAFVQALLSGAFAPLVGEDWPCPKVQIVWDGCSNRFTWVGLEAQIGPLLPLAKSYTFTESWGMDRVRERKAYVQPSSSAKGVIKLDVTMI